MHAIVLPIRNAACIGLALCVLSATTASAQTPQPQPPTSPPPKAQPSGTAPTPAKKPTPTPSVSRSFVAKLLAFGLQVGPIDEQMRATFSLAPNTLFVHQVVANTDAARSGLDNNDILVSVNGSPVNGAKHLYNRLRTIGPKGEIRFDVLRRGAPLTLTLKSEDRQAMIDLRQALVAKVKSEQEAVTVANKDALEHTRRAEVTNRELVALEGRVQTLQNAALSPQTLGLSVEDISTQLASLLGRPLKSGVFVSAVTAKSPAFVAGIQKNDLIVRVGNKAVTDLAGLRSVLDKAGHNAPLHFVMERGSQKISVRLVSANAAQLQSARQQLVLLKAQAAREQLDARQKNAAAAKQEEQLRRAQNELAKLDGRPVVPVKPVAQVNPERRTAPSAPTPTVTQQPAATPPPSVMNETSSDLGVGTSYHAAPSLVRDGVEHGINLSTRLSLSPAILAIAALETAFTPSEARRVALSIGLGWRQFIRPSVSWVLSGTIGTGIVQTVGEGAEMDGTDYLVPNAGVDVSLVHSGWLSLADISMGVALKSFLITTDGKEEVAGGPQLHVGLIW